MSDNIIEYTYETVLLGGSTWRNEIRTITSRYPGSRVLTVLSQDFGAGTLEQRESVIVVLEVPRAAAPVEVWERKDDGRQSWQDRRVGRFILRVVDRAWNVGEFSEHGSWLARATGYADDPKHAAKIVAEALLKDES